MAKIVVAIEASAASEKALEAAVELAQRDGGNLVAVSVLERQGDPHLERLAAGIKGQTRRQLEEMLHAAGNFARARGVNLTPLLREGHPGESIVSCAEQEQADILVLGASREAKLGLGATADQVSNHAPCTVMLVK